MKAICARISVKKSVRSIYLNTHDWQQYHIEFANKAFLLFWGPIGLTARIGKDAVDLLIFSDRT